MIAVELTAQSREQASLYDRERRDAKVKGKEEDAAKALKIEFDEMEGLEERVRRLREKREKLRLRRTKEAEKGLTNDGENGVEGRHAGEVVDDPQIIESTCEHNLLSGSL